MNHLVAKSDGSHLLKRSAHLVRTPIKVTLSPDQRNLYQVAGTWRSSGNVDWPDGGFIDLNTQSNCTAVGYNLLTAYTTHSDTRMGWGNVTTGREPETCWYQGSYATGAATQQGGTQSCEAYLQNAAYHFTIPQSLQDLELQSVTVKFTNGGAIWCYGTAGGKSNNNDAWRNHVTTGGTSWYLPFAVCQTLGHIQSIRQCPYDSKVDIMADSGGYKGVRDLWGYSGTNRDGGIPTLTTPQERSYTMGSQTLKSMSDNHGGWIVPFIDCSISSSTSYRPFCIPANPLYWACVSLWGLTLEAEFV